MKSYATRALGLWRTVPALRIPMILLGVAGLCAGIWLGLAWTGISPLDTVWLRVTLIVVVLGSLALFYGIAFMRRRKQAKDTRDMVRGDGDVISEKMDAALDWLRQRRGPAAIHEVPWYLMIGPPSAGKTQSLKNSGLEYPKFPDTDLKRFSGSGGTRDCGFWITSDAVLIDTAGRYATHESDAQADQASWMSLLGRIKDVRTRQPLNGVILTIPCDDLLSVDPQAVSDMETLALLMRSRLEEVARIFGTEVPVYLQLTKADLVDGFGDFFGDLRESERRAVWGATFPTLSSVEPTHNDVPQAFDTLVTRLTGAVTDRIQQMRDPSARVRIFGFPRAVGALSAPVARFAYDVFRDLTGTGITLRGFYFTSGDPHGMALDRVLGEQHAAYRSNVGKSYFVHDMFAKVIFEESGWVGHDPRAIRRERGLRRVGYAAVTVATLTLLGGLTMGYWSNTTLFTDANDDVRALNAALHEAGLTGADAPTTADRISLDLLIGLLDQARTLPGGYIDTQSGPILAGFGLSRRPDVSGQAVALYHRLLEAQLRPVLVHAARSALVSATQDGNLETAHTALRTYLILTDHSDVPAEIRQGIDTGAVESLDLLWAAEAFAPSQQALRTAAMAHVRALLDLRDPLAGGEGPRADAGIVAAARARIEATDQVTRALINIRGRVASPPDLVLSEALGGAAANDVLKHASHEDLANVIVPGFFTRAGYHDVFVPGLQALADSPTRNHDWVLDIELRETNNLSREVEAKYRSEFERIWRDTLDKLDLRPVLGADRREAMALLAHRENSPLRGLVHAVQTYANLRPDDSDGDPGRAGGQPFEALIDLDDELINQLLINFGALETALQAGDAQGAATAINNSYASRTLYPALLTVLIEDISDQHENYGNETVLRSMNNALSQICAPLQNRPYPFGRDASRPIAINTFGQLFGNGVGLDQFKDQFAGRLADQSGLSETALENLRRADVIRRTFFAPGSTIPTLERIGIRVAALDSNFRLRVSHRNAVTELNAANGNRLELNWPADTASIGLSIAGPVQGTTPSQITFAGGSWALMQMIQTGSIVSRTHNALTVLHFVGNIPVQIQISFDGDQIPFLISELDGFTCPTTMN